MNNKLEARVARLEKLIKNEDAELSHLIEAIHNTVNDLIDTISSHEKQSKLLDMIIHKEDKAINTIIDFIADHYYYDFSKGYLLSKKSVIADEASEVAGALAIYSDWEDKGYFDGDGDFDESVNRRCKNESSEDDGWRYTEPKDKIIKDWLRVNNLIRKNWEITSQTDNDKLSEIILEKEDQIIVYRVINYTIPSTGEHELHCIYTYDDNSPDESYVSESEVDVWKQDKKDPNKFYLSDAGMTYSEYKRSFRKGKPFIRK